MSTIDIADSTPSLDADTVEEVLDTAVSAAGAKLVSTSLRSIHHRSGRSRTYVHEATIEDDTGVRHALLVAHVDRRSLPGSAFVLNRGTTKVAVWRFPHDPWLPGLPSAIHPARVRELLDQLAAGDGEVTLRTRAYRPTRRAVVEVALDDGRQRGRVLYLKVMKKRRAAEVAAIHRGLEDVLPVPRLLGHAEAQGIVAQQAVGGATIREALVAGDPLPEPEALLELSDRLAATGLRTRRDPRTFADPVRHVPHLGELLPERREEIARLAAAAAAVEGPEVIVHGDLHDGQVLVTGGEITGLLDLDGVGGGLLAQDAGNLVAHLRAVGEVWPHVADRVDTYADELVEVYSRRVGADALARATAGAWIALATGPHRAQDQDWEATTHARLDRAAELLHRRA